MDTQDRQAIEKLFSKLSDVEAQGGYRDPESDRFIKERIGSQPGAPYFMAQTIVVQEQALAAAEDRIRELERGNIQQQQQSGGFFSSIFGSPNPQQNRQPSSSDRPSPWGQPQSPTGMQVQQRASGGFLAGAAQTAMGVAGGVMLGSALSGMFGGSEAKAAEPATEKPAEQPAEEQDTGMDLGFDDNDF